MKYLISPCRDACPLMRPIQRHNILLGYLGKLVETGLADEEVFLKIYDELFNFNPLFGICGYICGICENNCNRNEIDGPVQVRLIERFLFDWYKKAVNEGKFPPYRPIEMSSAKSEKVAIVGGGPAGLTAAFFLAKEGYKITLLESKSKLGGALRFIPSFRLPKDVLAFAIDQIVTPLSIEVQLKANIPINVLKRNYNVILIATGTPLPRPIPPFARDYPGVETAVEILSQISEGSINKDKYKGKKAVVIGGSGVAIDTARSLRRLGAEVALACLESADRTSKDGILANEEDEQAGKEEGITFYYSRGLDRVEKNNSQLHLTFSLCTSVYDLKDGRKIFNPQFDASDTISVNTDFLVFAIGQLPDREYLKEILDENGRLMADPLTLSTSEQGVFVAGDVFRIGRAAEAIRAGKEAANSIKGFLEHKELKREKIEYFTVSLPYLKERILINPPQKTSFLALEQRLHSFDLEQEGFDLKQVILEAQRCLHCDICDNCRACVTLGFRQDVSKMYVIEEKCDGCGYCVDVCVYNAIKIIEYTKNNETKKTIEVNTYLCRGCGSCQATCPKEGCAIPGFSLAEFREQINNYLGNKTQIIQD